MGRQCLIRFLKSVTVAGPYVFTQMHTHSCDLARAQHGLSPSRARASLSFRSEILFPWVTLLHKKNKASSLSDRSGGCGGRGGCGGSLGRIGAQEYFVLGSHLSPDLLLLANKLLETRGGEGECLPPEPHQIGILQPRVAEAVFDGGTCPGI